MRKTRLESSSRTLNVPGFCAMKEQVENARFFRLSTTSKRTFFSASCAFFSDIREKREIFERETVFFTTRQTIENTPYFHGKSPFFRKNRIFLRKIAFFFVFPLDNAQLWGYIWLTLNLEECP